MDSESTFSQFSGFRADKQLHDRDEIARIKRKVLELKKRALRTRSDRQSRRYSIEMNGPGMAIPGTSRKRKVWSPNRNIPKGILDPDGQLRIWWDIWVAFLVTYNMIALPVDLAFEVGSSLLVYEITVDCMFIMDIFFNFRTAYYDHENDLVTEPRKIAKNYIMSKWLTLDILASIPWSIIFLIIGSSGESGETIQSLATLNVLKTLRLFRLSRLWRIISKMRFSAVVNVMRMGLLFLISAHWFGCMFHLLQKVENADRNWRTEQGILVNESLFNEGNEYLLSLYWSVVTITTVGYGDISPVTFYEKIYGLFVICFGTLLYMSVFGALAAVMSNLIDENPIYSEKMKALVDFTRTAQLSKSAQKRVLDYYNFNWDQKKSFNSRQSILDEFPDGLRVEVATEINLRMLKKNLMFNKIRSKDEFRTDLVDVLAAALSSPLVSSRKIFLEGEYLFYDLDPIKNVYFLLKGTVEQKSDDVITQVSDGGFLGNIGLFPDAEMSENRHIPRHTVRALALEMCDVYCLHRESFISALQGFYKARELITWISRKKTNLFSGREPVYGGNLKHEFFNGIPVEEKCHIGELEVKIYNDEAVVERLIGIYTGDYAGYQSDVHGLVGDEVAVHVDMEGDSEDDSSETYKTNIDAHHQQVPSSPQSAFSDAGSERIELVLANVASRLERIERSQFKLKQEIRRRI